MTDPNLDDCCEFNYPEPDGEDSWHYTRTCTHCGQTWGALHCMHDGAQNPCPHCGHVPAGTSTPLAILFPDYRGPGFSLQEIAEIEQSLLNLAKETPHG